MNVFVSRLEYKPKKVKTEHDKKAKKRKHDYEEDEEEEEVFFKHLMYLLSSSRLERLLFSFIMFSLLSGSEAQKEDKR